MGFRTVREMNLAMLGKQGWKLFTNQNALVTRVFKARYFPTCSFLEAGLGSNPSFVWSSIRNSQSLITRGARVCVRDGSTTRVWNVPWLPNKQNPYVSTPEPIYLNNPCVRSLFIPNTLCWDEEVVRDIFNCRDANLILSLPTSNRPVGDSWYWDEDLSREYSVKSAYRVLRQDLSIEGTVDCDVACHLCGLEQESIVHLFANCSFIHDCWGELNQYWRLEYVDNIDLWIAAVWSSLPKEMITKIIVICWVAWENRNQVVFHQHCLPPKVVVANALRYLDDWRTVNELHAQATFVSSSGASYFPTAWQPPLHSFVKINVDVALDFDRNVMGFGWVVRGEEGEVLGLGWRLKEYVCSIREAEAVGVREVLSWVKEMGWNRVIVETDAQLVTTAVKGGLCSGLFGLIIQDIRFLLDQFFTVNLCFVKREANMLAHAIAKRSLRASSSGDVIPTQSRLSSLLNGQVLQSSSILYLHSWANLSPTRRNFCTLLLPVESEDLSTSTSYRCQQQDRWISKASLPIPIIFVPVYMEKDTKSAIDNGIDLGFQEWGPNPKNAKAILWGLDIPLHLS
ncbi:uncharacterized protein LOC116020480 [Ipomoea triloba]|uniref:uncharacterized protein LOC116020480 n=1 Tax=Ipomoea triloba TaxID=35885 RepID=UPI00125CF4A1|nr:uncharacterized protein LOC116020480 [Ipomoea triloba]